MRRHPETTNWLKLYCPMESRNLLNCLFCTFGRVMNSTSKKTKKKNLVACLLLIHVLSDVC